MCKFVKCIISAIVISIFVSGTALAAKTDMEEKHYTDR